MRRLLSLLMIFCTASVHGADALPYEFHGYADLRAVAVDSPLESFAYGGLGLLRFDEGHDGVQVGRLMFDLSGPIAETLRIQATASATTDDDHNPIDLTEAFIEWRPYPRSPWRWRSRVGAFYPPISLENGGVGWQSLYSLSPSAINTWIGEEIRAIGFEATVTNAGATLQRPFDVSLVVGVYGWNDPMGVLLFERGWAIHDRETVLFGGLPRPFQYSPDNETIEFFHEIDERPGYYTGVELKWLGRHVFRALHYDNRGDPARSNGEDFAWLTRFDALGARIEAPWNFTFIVQGMVGDTSFGPSADGRGMLIADFWSYFALASRAQGAHRFTLRYDRMFVESTRGAEWFDSEQDAHGWTAAYFFERDDHWRFGVEAVRIDGMLGQRTLVGLAAAAVEEQVQLAIRYSF
jgi:hypothetical protein